LTLTENPPARPAATDPVCPTPDGFAGLNQQARDLQALIDRAQQLPDPAARGLFEECLQSVLAFYGEGLGRLLELIEQTGEPGKELLHRFVQEPAISGLLFIHGLHPVDLHTRLQQALDKVRPYLESHGGNVELLSLENGYARLRLRGACKACPSSSITLELAVRRALEEACPDLLGFNVE
jgi:Fe-S cluster biogenesis protein NfuA